MATLLTSSISSSKIKTRWQEPYVSEALNRQLTAMPRGVYRGFILKQSATPNQSFRIRVDTGSSLFNDSMLVYKDDVNGFSALLRESSDVSLSMASAVTWPIVGDQTWYVWASVTYAVSSQTVGSYYVTDTVPPSSAIVLGQINMLNGDTTIVDSRISTVLKTVPVPTKREDGAYVSGDQIYGLLSGEESWNILSSEQKRAINACAGTLSASNPVVSKTETLDKVMAESAFVYQTKVGTSDRFTLTGWYYVGKGGYATANKYFSARNDVIPDFPLTAFSASNHQVLFSVYKSDDSAVLDPVLDADANGFYQNPVLRMTTYLGAYTMNSGTNFNVHCFRTGTFGAMPTSSSPITGMDMRQHSDRVTGSSVTGTPDSLTSGLVSEQLGLLLGFINSRMLKTNLDSASWIRIWQSQTTDTRDTVSFYYKTGNFIVIKGASLSGTSDSCTPFSGSGSVQFIWIDNAGIVFGFQNVIVGTPIAMGTSTAWTVYESLDEYGLSLRGGINANCDINLEGNLSIDNTHGILTDRPDTEGVVGQKILQTNVASGATLTGKTRIYDDGYGGIKITYNASWNGSVWNKDSVSLSSYAFNIGPVDGIAIELRDDISGTWTIWDSAKQLANYYTDALYLAPNAIHNVRDQVKYVLFATNFWATSQVVIDMTSVTWHGYITGISSGDITVASEGNSGWTDLPTVDNITAVGCTISGTSDSVSSGGMPYNYGRLSVNT